MMARALRNYGQRARIGMIVPPTNTVNEAEWAMLAPQGVSLHAMRMPLHADVGSPVGQMRLFDDLREAIALLAQAPLDAIAYCCTAGSLLLPYERIGDYMTSCAAMPSIATAPALVDACRALAVSRIALATPYHDALNRHETAYFEACGIRVVHCKGLGIGAGGAGEFTKIASVPSDEVMALADSADHEDAQAMIISCTDLATLKVLDRLEDLLGKPVISSNQATFWRVLRAVGLEDRIPDAGSLLNKH